MKIIRGLREDKDLTQTEVAKKLGTTQQLYSKYETGIHDLPLRFVPTIAKLFNVSTDYLFGHTKCKVGVDALNQVVEGKVTLGEVATDILSLSSTGREDVIEYIHLMKMKEASQQQSNGLDMMRKKKKS